MRVHDTSFIGCDRSRGFVNKIGVNISWLSAVPPMHAISVESKRSIWFFADVANTKHVLSSAIFDAYSFNREKSVEPAICFVCCFIKSVIPNYQISEVKTSMQSKMSHESNTTLSKAINIVKLAMENAQKLWERAEAEPPNEDIQSFIEEMYSICDLGGCDMHLLLLDYWEQKKECCQQSSKNELENQFKLLYGIDRTLRRSVVTYATESLEKLNDLFDRVGIFSQKQIEVNIVAINSAAT